MLAGHSGTEEPNEKNNGSKYAGYLQLVFNHKQLTT